MKSSASELINALIERYGTCNAYKDSGTATCLGTTIRFSTYFVRPDKFLLEWTDVASGKKKAVRGNADQRQLFSQGAWSNKDVSLDYALTIAGGASMGVSAFIGRLLLQHPSELLDYMPFDYQPAEHESTQTETLISDPSHRLITKVLTIDPSELKILNLESRYKTAVIDKLRDSLPVSEDLEQRNTDALRDALIGAAPPTYRTEFQSVTFDQMTESDLDKLNSWKSN